VGGWVGGRIGSECAAVWEGRRVIRREGGLESGRVCCGNCTFCGLVGADVGCLYVMRADV